MQSKNSKIMADIFVEVFLSRNDVIAMINAYFESFKTRFSTNKVPRVVITVERIHHLLKYFNFPLSLSPRPLLLLSDTTVVVGRLESVYYF